MPYLSYLLILVIAALLVACSSEQEQMLAEGQQLYQENCKVCHAQGINGAPILGNTKMWSKRAGQGLPVLVDHAMNGYGLMPAKGGNQKLQRSDVEKVVSYMLKQLDLRLE